MNGPRTVRSGFALAAVCTALGLTMLDATTVSVILPNLRSDLQVGVTGLQWVIASYLLTFAALMLAGATLGDLYGRRRLLLIGIAVFVAGSLTSALAVNLSLLYAGRVVQGLGAAACEPGTLSLLRQLYPDQAGRARAVGLWAGVSGLALAAGPVLGGLLVEAGSWRYVFYFNVVLGAAALLGCARTVPESADPQGRRLDPAGQLTWALALALLTFGLIVGQQDGFTASWVLAAFAGAALAGTACYLVERRVASPALNLAMLGNRLVAGANLLAFAASFAIFAVFLFLSLYLQLVAGSSALATAARFAPMSLGMVLGAPLGGRWVARGAVRAPLATGTAAGSAGLLGVLVVLRAGAGTPALLAALAVLGTGLGLLLPPVTATVLSAVPRERSGMAAATTNVSRQVGALAGVSVLGAVLVHQLTVDLASRLAARGVPAAFRELARAEVTTGRLSLPISLLRTPHAAALLAEVLQLGKVAFTQGMQLALLVSAVVLAGSGLVALVALRRPARQDQVDARTPTPS